MSADNVSQESSDHCAGNKTVSYQNACNSQYIYSAGIVHRSCRGAVCGSRVPVDSGRGEDVQIATGRGINLITARRLWSRCERRGRNGVPIVCREIHRGMLNIGQETTVRRCLRHRHVTDVVAVRGRQVARGWRQLTLAVLRASARLSSAEVASSEVVYARRMHRPVVPLPVVGATVLHEAFVQRQIVSDAVAPRFVAQLTVVGEAVGDAAVDFGEKQPAVRRLKDRHGDEGDVRVVGLVAVRWLHLFSPARRRPASAVSARHLQRVVCSAGIAAVVSRFIARRRAFRRRHRTEATLTL